MPLKQTLSRHWFRFQRELFPWLEEALGPLGERYQRLVRVLELVRVEEWLPYSRGWRGRPLKDRAALARAFLAKAVLLDVPTTRGLVDSLYDLMDSAYDAPEIRAFSQKLGHVPIIDLNPRRRPQVKAERKREALAQRRIGQVSPEARRTREALDRGAGERTAQGRLWRAVPEGSRPWQGVVPADVRHSRADGGAVDAPDAISRSRWIPDNAG